MYQNEKIRVPAQFCKWFEGPGVSFFWDNFKILHWQEYSSLNF